MEKNITIAGIYDHDVSHFVKAKQIIEKSGFKLAKIISHKVPLSGIKDVMDTYIDKKTFEGSLINKIVVSPWRENK